MKLLTQKSLKSELQLKRYEVLKLQGQIVKLQGLGLKESSKLRARLELIKMTGASVQVCRI
jgi:hypothetical protein